VSYPRVPLRFTLGDTLAFRPGTWLSHRPGFLAHDVLIPGVDVFAAPEAGLEPR